MFTSVRAIFAVGLRRIFVNSYTVW